MIGMTNLLEETEEVLSENGLGFEDVRYIIDGTNISYDVNGFKEKCREFDYDSGFGCVNVNSRIELHGHGWWMERREYDGSEWWEFRREITPKKYTEGDIELSEYEYKLQTGVYKKWDT